MLAEVQFNLHASKTRVDGIAGSTARDPFFKIRIMLHVADGLQEQTPDDTHWKVRPLMEKIRKACRLIPLSNVCSGDEQLIPFTGHSARMLEFEFYQGQ